jgi:glycosyltransferase involved in cell wall biosynthesis
MVSAQAPHAATAGDAEAEERDPQVVELSAAVSRHGHSVTVYTAVTGDQQRRGPALGDLTIVELPTGPARTGQPLSHLNHFAEQVARQVDTVRPDILHSHGWTSGMVAALVGRTYRVPVVHNSHEPGARGRRDTSPTDLMSIQRAVARAATLITADSSAGVFELIRMGVPRTKISVVTPGVDLDEFTPDGPRADRRPPLRRIIGLGALSADQGFGDLIDALPAIPNTELVIVGGPARDRLADDPPAGWLRERAARRGVTGRVELTGRVDREQLPALLRSADLAACVPWSESFGQLALQAMACGLPLLATAVDEHTDIVTDGITGALIPPRQPATIAATATKLLNDPGWLQAMGAAACDRARARYSWDRTAHDTVHIYQRSLGSAAAGPGRGRTAR